MTSTQLYIVNQVTIPPTVPTITAGGGGNLGDGDYIYAVSFITNVGETLPGNPTAATASGGANASFTITNIPIGPAYCGSRKIYRTIADGATLLVAAIINDNTTTSYLDTLADAQLGNAPVASNLIDPALIVNGTLNIAGTVKATVVSSTIAFGSIGNGTTCNGAFNNVTITSMTTAAQINSALIVKNNYVTATSKIIATIDSYTGTLGTNGVPTVSISAISLGKYTINITNAGAANALSDDVAIFCQIIN